MVYKNLRLVLLSLAFALTCFAANFFFPKILLIPLAAAVFSLIPYYLVIFKSALKKQLDLSLPPIITIYILLFLGKGNVAILFILIILLGHLFKTYILERVKASVTSISQKLPKTAFIKEGGEEIEIEITKIKIGDILAVKSGERVPTDAELLSEDALLDESVITGESKPVPKATGGKILAGSINTGNYFEAKVTASAENSTLFQIQHLVDNAQNEKAPLARIVSKYAWITTIFALFGVILIFILTENVITALSFWIAIVPVIFAIIVPVATTIGITILAKNGVLVKNSTSLENLTKSDTILFDKTGTITQGAPEVETILEISGNQKELLRLCASIESYSDHPLSIPILNEAKKQNIQLLTLTRVKTVVGKGMLAKYGGKDVFLGNTSLLRSEGISVDGKTDLLVSSWEKKGATPVFVGEDKKLLGVILLLDKLRAESLPLLETLKNNGYQTIIVTGDKEEVAKTISKELNDVPFISDVTPQGKVETIDKKLKEGKNIVMVGDGINDAPALAKAQVGIAMGGKGVDLTLNAADIVLLSNNISSIPSMINVSKRTFRIIKEDVALATVIHFFAAVLVVLGAITLIETAFIHEISSALVLLNTLRIFRVRIDKKSV